MVDVMQSIRSKWHWRSTKACVAVVWNLLLARASSGQWLEVRQASHCGAGTAAAATDRREVLRDAAPVAIDQQAAHLLGRAMEAH